MRGSYAWRMISEASAARHCLSWRVNMKYELLDTVVLNRDLPTHHLREGDLGAIVQIYEPDGIEVEFVTASGRTGALVTLTSADVRPVADTDIVAVRSLKRSA